MRYVFDERAECIFVYCGDELILVVHYKDLTKCFLQLHEIY